MTNGPSSAPSFHPVAHLQASDALLELAQQGVGGRVADRHRDGDRHAAFACRAIGRADESICGLVEIGIRHHDHVVFRAA